MLRRYVSRCCAGLALWSWIAAGCTPATEADPATGTGDPTGSGSAAPDSSDGSSSSGEHADGSSSGEVAGSSTGDTACAEPERAVTQEVSLVTATGTLYGTWMAPDGCPPFRSVLFHVGSGPTDRDGNNPLVPGTNDGHLQLAQALQAAGVATLRFDKRGIGQSARALPDPTTVVIEDYMADLQAWVELLRTQPEVVGSLTLLGHSEGSLIGTIVAQRAPVDAFVSMAGPGRPLGDVLLQQLEPQLEPEVYAQAVAIIEQLEQGIPVPARDVPPELASLFGPQIQAFVISLLAYDPALELARVPVPVTIVGGTSDVQVPPSEAQVLAAAAPDADLVILEGMTHVLKTDALGQDAAYTDPAVPLADGLVRTVLAAVAP
jgi:uncharacterized protein